jgi:exodeoxyribonuclease V alpha subunit
VTTLHAYAAIWLKRGRAEAARWEPSPDAPVVERISVLLLDAGSIVEADLCACRMLYDTVYPGDDPHDHALQLFLLMMCSSLNAGNVFLPAGPGEMVDALCADVKRARAQAASQDASLPGVSGLESTHELRTLVQTFVNAANDGRYAAIIGPKARPIVQSGDRWYFQRYHAAEHGVSTQLTARMAAEMPRPDTGRMRAVLAEVFAGIPAAQQLDPTQRVAVALACVNRTTVITGGPGTGKTSVVAHALRALLRLKPELDPVEDIVLCAPTGRAAARLAESIGRATHSLSEDNAGDRRLALLRSRTVHGVLGYDHSTGRFRRGPDSPVEAALVVVDEVSMLDIVIFRGLLDALSPGTALILLGDRDQLPSVEAGAVLGDLSAPFVESTNVGVETAVPSVSPELHAYLCEALGATVDPSIVSPTRNPLTDHFVVLTRSHRSEKSIARFAHLVKTHAPATRSMIATAYQHAATEELFGDATGVWTAGGASGVLRSPSTDLPSMREAWVEAHFGAAYAACLADTAHALTDGIAAHADAGRAAALSTAAAEVQAPLRRLFSYLEASTVLCVVRRGPAGSEAANATALRMLRSSKSGGDPHDLPHGCIALVTRNRPDLRLWNGDRGIVLDVAGRACFVMQRSAGHEFFPLEEMAGLEPSFAMTVHKSQGSEFGSVLLVLPEQIDHPLLTREIIYTALTRAGNCVVIAGSAQAFDASISRCVMRRSALLRA